MGNVVPLAGPRPGPVPARREALADLPAERAVLAAVLLDKTGGREVLPRLRALLPSGDLFAARDHAVVWDAMLALGARGEPIDAMTLARELEAGRVLGRLPGGRQFLGDLTDEHFTTAHCEAHAKLVADASARRALALLGQDLAVAAQDLSRGVLATRDQFVRALGAVRIGTDAAARIGAVFEALVTDWQAQLDGTAPATGLSTGLTPWDAATGGGLHVGELVVIAARPRVGKTALAIQALAEIARTRGPVYFASLEMSRREVSERLLACTTGVPYDRVLYPIRQSQEDAEALWRAMGDLDRLPLFVRDRKPCTVADLGAAARVTRDRTGLACVAVDHLGKLDPTKAWRDRRDAVREISGALADLAEELNVPVLVLAHINRSVTSGSLARKPRIEDLAESSAIEADADTIVLLHREDLYPTAHHEAKPEPGITEALVLKQRKAPSGNSFRLRFNGSIQRFEEEYSDV